jgi:NAD(P)-dependent dehydrogenase (short-subunit alcohol dehydrogenase family)
VRSGWQVAFITGGGRGQGRAHALALAAEGANIAIADAPGPMNLTYPLGTEDDLRVTSKHVEELGSVCLPIAMDVRDAAAVKAAVEETVGTLGPKHRRAPKGTPASTQLASAIPRTACADEGRSRTLTRAA